jgi:hypothetical protein
MLVSVPPVLPVGTTPTAEPRAPRTIRMSCPTDYRGRPMPPQLYAKHQPVALDVRYDGAEAEALPRVLERLELTASKLGEILQQLQEPGRAESMMARWEQITKET